MKTLTPSDVAEIARSVTEKLGEDAGLKKAVAAAQTRLTRDLCTSLDTLAKCVEKTPFRTRANLPAGLEVLSTILKDLDLKAMVESNHHSDDSRPGASEGCPSCSTLFNIGRSLLNAAVARGQDDDPALRKEEDQFDGDVRLWSLVAHNRAPELLKDVLHGTAAMDAKWLSPSSYGLNEDDKEHKSAFQAARDTLESVFDTSKDHGSTVQHVTQESADCPSCREARAAAASLSREVSYVQGKLSEGKSWAATTYVDYSKFLETAVDFQCKVFHTQDPVMSENSSDQSDASDLSE